MRLASNVDDGDGNGDGIGNGVPGVLRLVRADYREEIVVLQELAARCIAART